MSSIFCDLSEFRRVKFFIGTTSKDVKARDISPNPKKGILLKKSVQNINDPSEKSFQAEVTKFNRNTFIKSKFRRTTTKLESSIMEVVSHKSSNNIKKGTSRFHMNKTVTTLNDIPSSSDLAVKKTRKRVQNQVEVALKIQAKAANRRRVGMADIFGAEINMDQSTLNMMKTTFIYAKSMLAINKKVALAHFTMIPQETKLPHSLSSLQLSTFEQSLDTFLANFVKLLKSSYILHEPELAMTCILHLHRHDQSDISSTRTELDTAALHDIGVCG